MEKQLKQDIRNSRIDGVFSHMFATLMGGMFLTGFAIHLGMNELMIGLLASMPFIGAIFQLPASFIIWKNGRRKKFSFIFSLLARTLWLPILVLAFLPLTFEKKTFSILCLIFLSYTFASVSYVSWLSWISDLIPDNIRGSFFGTRNMLCGAAGIVVMIVFGKILDLQKYDMLWALPMGFSLTFFSAVLFGVMSLFFLKKVSEPRQRERINSNNTFFQITLIPFKDSNFRHFLIFAFLWSFSVYFASPFFTLYFLRDLKFSYSFIAFLSFISAFMDMTGMQVWGRISDKVRNKAVIQMAVRIAVFLPLAWVTVRPDSIIMPIILQIIGGGFWAGINLCMNNLLLRISPQNNRAFFLSTYNIVGGLGAAAGPIIAGFVLTSIDHLNLSLFSWKVHHLHVIFMASTLLRLLSIQVFTYVQEPEAATVKEAVRILRSMRGMNITNGFNYMVYPFIPVGKKLDRRL